MSALAKKIVVVGGGNAAGYFARACVAAGRGSELTIVAAENVLPYERPALTKGFLHKEGPPRLPGFHTCVGGGGERQTQEWYDANGVEVLLNTRVCAADLPKKTITTVRRRRLHHLRQARRRHGMHRPQAPRLHRRRPPRRPLRPR